MGMVVGSPFLAVETMFLMPCFRHDMSYSAMMAFLSMGSDYFGPDEFKQNSFNECERPVLGFDVMLFLLGSMLSCIDE